MSEPSRGGTLALRVDTRSPIPPYEQIRGQLATLIAAGRLPPGHRLPPVRQLAADLGLAAGTVARAYRELEAAGQVATRRAAGTRVLQPSPPVPYAAELAGLAREFADGVLAIGADADSALAAVRAALDQHS
ncbi:GntR family transcriptional regulator [Streptacidiphilus sp. MAP12-20]|uniref:GntR family transcriptional regulator n=1 Tax=Streptacidiphilus sp. MAP12-20 TaxID=3156299 RepID=UPI003518DE42